MLLANKSTAFLNLQHVLTGLISDFDFLDADRHHLKKIKIFEQNLPDKLIVQFLFEVLQARTPSIFACLFTNLSSIKMKFGHELVQPMAIICT